MEGKRRNSALIKLRADPTFKFKEVITISCETYNVDIWEKALVEKCIHDNPSFSQKELAELLGMSERNFARICKNYKIDLSPKAKEVRYSRMLETLGIDKKHDTRVS